MYRYFTQVVLELLIFVCLFVLVGFFMFVFFRGLDFSSMWHDSYIKAKKQIISTLHILHPTMKTLLDFGYTAFFNFLVVDFSSTR